jgi:hypothetical protein
MRNFSCCSFSSFWWRKHKMTHLTQRNKCFVFAAVSSALLKHNWSIFHSTWHLFTEKNLTYFTRTVQPRVCTPAQITRPVHNNGRARQRAQQWTQQCVQRREDAYLPFKPTTRPVAAAAKKITQLCALTARIHMQMRAATQQAEKRGVKARGCAGAGEGCAPLVIRYISARCWFRHLMRAAARL